MGKRGPQPVDVERLKSRAKSWATLLFGVRDGAKGVAEKWDQPLIIGIVKPKDRAKTEALLIDLKAQGYRIGWPLYRSPNIWNELKRAISTKQMSKTVKSLREWRRRESLSFGSDELLRNLQRDPRILLRAKRLPNYPRRQETNDNKRVIFIAKVLAGLEMGRKPLYATKMLSHWRCDNYWDTVSTQYVESFPWAQPAPQKASTR